MEMHVGSVDEGENEQGIAHMIEHVTFLGSKKREQLLAHGARSNAYTDFHHTVFHVHAPVLVPVLLSTICCLKFWSKTKFFMNVLTDSSLVVILLFNFRGLMNL